MLSQKGRNQVSSSGVVQYHITSISMSERNMSEHSNDDTSSSIKQIVQIWRIFGYLSQNHIVENLSFSIKKTRDDILVLIELSYLMESYLMQKYI